jgi:hypothetical protein
MKVLNYRTKFNFFIPFSGYPLKAPTAATAVIGVTSIIWKWKTSATATGYKWHTENDYAAATDTGTTREYKEEDLTGGTTYTRYVWAYNANGHSEHLVITLTTETNISSNLLAWWKFDNNMLESVTLNPARSAKPNNGQDYFGLDPKPCGHEFDDGLFSAKCIKTKFTAGEEVDVLHLITAEKLGRVYDDNKEITLCYWAKRSSHPDSGTFGQTLMARYYAFCEKNPEDDSPASNTAGRNAAWCICHREGYVKEGWLYDIHNGVYCRYIHSTMGYFNHRIRETIASKDPAWNHYAYTIKKGAQKFYKNGVEILSGSETDAIVYSDLSGEDDQRYDQPFHIATLKSWVDPFEAVDPGKIMPMYLQDSMLFNKALTAAQINKVRNREAI